MKRKVLVVLLSVVMVCTSTDVQVYATEGIMEANESETQEAASEEKLVDEESESSGTGGKFCAGNNRDRHVRYF